MAADNVPSLREVTVSKGINPLAVAETLLVAPLRKNVFVGV